MEDFNDSVKSHGLLKGAWYSDLFNPLYRLFNLPKRLCSYISRFYYYGKVGASETFDFDANSVDHLIYAHIRRVRKFMDSDKTHLVWNSSGKTGLMKKLYEFEELCKRKCEYDDFNDLYYFSKAMDKYGRGVKNEVHFCGTVGYRYEQTEKAKKQKHLASKKDRKIAKQREERYYELLTKYMSQFWD